MTAILTEEQRAKVIETHERNDSSYDNGNGHAQVHVVEGDLAYPVAMASENPEARITVISDCSDMRARAKSVPTGAGRCGH